jgi:hypothetical protein
MSISMCEKEGVPSVMTMSWARAASSTRSESSSRPLSRTRSSSSWVPVSLKGIEPARTAASRSGSLSMPSTDRPRSAKERARGRPTRPRPMIETSGAML